MKLSITAFRACDYPSLCEEFMEGHANVLRDIGISVNKLTSANISWSKSKDSYVITARSLEDFKVVGGARIDIAGGSLSLPIEAAVGMLDTRIYDLVKEKAVKGTGEVCGVWTSQAVAGRGIALLLLRAAISLSTQLRLSSLFVFCSEATFSMFTKLGCTVYKSLGNDGTFYYPKENLLATVLILHDPDTLCSADEINRNSVFLLRSDPKQEKVENAPKGDLYVKYDLLISSLCKI
jgi:ribosomal protein S18 acetylase RimI-like enzyme